MIEQYKRDRMESIIDFSEQSAFNVANMSFGVPKVGGAGGKSIGMFYNKTYMQISVPKMIQWGASDFKDKDGVGNEKFDFTLQFPTEDYKTPETTNALEHFKAIEEGVLRAALENSMKWFGKKYTKEVLLALWSPMLKYPKDKATGEPNLAAAPGLKVKLPFWEGVPKFEIYDEDSNLVFPNQTGKTAVDLVEKGLSVHTLVQCGGIWIAGGKFGMTWKAVQIVIPKPKPSIMGTCFLKKKSQVQVQVESDGEEEEVVQKAAAPSRLTRQASVAAADPFVNDSDEEDGQEQAVTVAAAVAVEENADEEPSTPQVQVQVQQETVVKKKVTKRK
jgi:hypothetical protein